MEVMSLSGWIFLFECFYHFKFVSPSTDSCTFENVKCVCWDEHNGLHVNCSGNNITESIPRFNDSVVWLDLSHNRITKIPPQTLPKYLVYLDLSQNDITNVKKEFFNALPQLEFLDLSNCSIKNVDEGSFGDLSNLLTLNISFNRNLGFASLSNVTYDLNKTRIRSLHLNGITCEIGAGTTIRNHHLRHLRGTNITELSLNYNRLEIFELNVIKNLPQTLEIFSLAKNRLEPGECVIEFEALYNLKVLNTSLQNDAAKFPEFVRDQCRDKIEEPFVDVTANSINSAGENYYNNSYCFSNWTICSPPKLETFDARFC
jgi:hypothetical protein